MKYETLEKAKKAVLEHWRNWSGNHYGCIYLEEGEYKIAYFQFRYDAILEFRQGQFGKLVDLI